MIETFDLYGKTFNMHIKGKEKYKTAVGAILGVISVLIIVGVSVYFVLDLISRENFSLVYNEDESKMPVNNLSNATFTFAISDFKSNPIMPTAGIFEFDAKMVTFGPSKPNGERDVDLSPIQLERCEKKHFGEDAELYKNYYNLDDDGDSGMDSKNMKLMMPDDVFLKVLFYSLGALSVYVALKLMANMYKKRD
jgi:hypothetical protein